MARTLCAQKMGWMKEVLVFKNLNYHSNKLLDYDDGAGSLDNYSNSTDYHVIALSHRALGEKGHVIGLKKRPSKAFDPNYGITSFDKPSERLGWLKISWKSLTTIRSSTSSV